MFNRQSRLLLGGFASGNLVGNIDVYDRCSLTKLLTVDVSIASHCECSADGNFIFTATLSPCLRAGAAPASSSNPDSVKQRKRKGPKEKGKGGGSPGGGAVECPAAVDPVLKVEASHRTMVPCYTSGLSYLILYKIRLEI